MESGWSILLVLVHSMPNVHHCTRPNSPSPFHWVMACSPFIFTGPLASKLLILFVAILSLTHLTAAVVTATSGNTKYVQTSDDQGNAVWLKDSRKPALYTQDFGDCLGNSLINVTRFDAAYYQDNMTVLFHLEGNTNVANESLMCRLKLSRQLASPLLTRKKCT